MDGTRSEPKRRDRELADTASGLQLNVDRAQKKIASFGFSAPQCGTVAGILRCGVAPVLTLASVSHLFEDVSVRCACNSKLYTLRSVS